MANLSLPDLLRWADSMFVPNSQRHNEISAGLATLTVALQTLAKHGLILGLHDGADDVVPEEFPKALRHDVLGHLEVANSDEQAAAEGKGYRELGASSPSAESVPVEPEPAADSPPSSNQE